MSLPTTEELQSLAEAEPTIAISAFIPFDDDSPDAVQTNQIRIKNLISDISNVLDKNSTKLETKQADILEPLTSLRDDTQRLWQRQMRGLAVFVDETQLQYYLLPMAIDEPVFQIQESFYLEPLTAAADDNQTFYALSISHNHAQLYKANHYDMEPVSVPNLPTEGMEEALSTDEYPESHQFHGVNPRSTRGNGEAGGAQHHGHYEPKQVDKKLLEQYFRRINDAIQNYLQNSQAPLVFAGVDYLFPIYQRANSYHHLSSGPDTGNYEKSTQDELHQLLVKTLTSS